MNGRTQIFVDDEFAEFRICDLKRTDAGVYEFVAENEIGKDSVTVPVTVTGIYLYFPFNKTTYANMSFY